LQQRAILITSEIFFTPEMCTLFHSPQTSSGAHPDSYLMRTMDYSPGVKRPKREADRSPPPSAEVKNGGDIPPSPIRLHGLVLT
jgi:hypothetical protein